MDRIDWLEWRKKGLGASDAPIIMDVSPWKTALQLWEEKTSTEPVEDKESYITRQGNDWEPKVRSLVELLEGQEFEVALMEHSEIHYLRVSFDGINPERDLAIEIKMSGKEDFNRTANENLSVRERIPEKYWPQLQHQLLFVPKVLYCSHLLEKGMQNVDASKLAIVKVTPDIEYQKQYLKAVQKFWNCVLDKKAPPPSVRDYKRLKGVDDEIEKWKSVKAQIEALEAVLAETREKILAAATASGHPRLVCAGVRVRRESRAGSISYANIPAVKAMSKDELEKYRGKPVESWKFEMVTKEME